MIKKEAKILWGKNWNIVSKYELYQGSYMAGSILTPANLGYKKDEVEYLNYFSTNWRPSTK